MTEYMRDMDGTPLTKDAEGRYVRVRADRAQAVDEANALGYREGYRTATARERARIKAGVERYRRAYLAVHSAYDGECEHGFGPPATKCPNGECPDREFAESWAAVLRIVEGETAPPQHAVRATGFVAGEITTKDDWG